MAFPGFIQTPYSALTVILPDGVRHNLTTLLQAVDPNVPLMGREVTIQVDTNVAGNLFIGDALVNITPGSLRYGYRMASGASRTYRTENVNDVPIQSLWVITDTPTLQLNVEITLF